MISERGYLLLAAVFWSIFWAGFFWATYRYVLNRLLRLVYKRIGIPAEENARRLGFAMVGLAILGGFRLGGLLYPDVPARVHQVADMAMLALVVILAMRLFESLAIDAYLEHRRETRIPRLLRDIGKVLAYLAIFMTVAHQAYGLNVYPLLTTSAVFTMVMGLAMQDTLSNVFAGLASSIDQQYRLDDWITADGFRGRVVAINWRSTVIESAKGDRITIPNTVLGKSRVVVHARWPRGIHREDFKVRVSYVVPAQQVYRLLVEAVADLPYVEKDPKPKITLGDPEEQDIPYVLSVAVKDGTYPPVRTEVPLRIWYALARENIAMGGTLEEGDAPRPPGTRIDTPEEIEETRRIFARVDFLAALAGKDLELLVRSCHVRLYASGEYLFRQGEEGGVFYVIRRGRVGVIVKKDAGEEVQVAALEAGAYFGEMSLLTGEKRSATIQALGETAVLAITRENLKALLAADPTAADTISRVIAERSLQTQKELAAKRERILEDAGAVKEAAKARSMILKNIRSFFQLT